VDPELRDEILDATNRYSTPADLKIIRSTGRLAQARQLLDSVEELKAVL